MSGSRPSGRTREPSVWRHQRPARGRWGHQRGVACNPRRRARGVRQDAPGRGPRGSTPRRPAACGGSPSRGRCARRGWEVAADYLVLEWVPPGRLSAAGAEELGRGLALTHARAPARRASATRRRRRGSPVPRRLRLAAAPQRPRPRLADVLRRAPPAPPGASCARARRALGVRRAGGRGACASACPSSRARRSPRRGCTGTCGPAT